MDDGEATRFGLTVRRAREALASGGGRAPSQRRIAAGAGISHTWVAQIERGAVVPEREVVERLADALGRPRKEFLAAAGHFGDDVERLLRARPALSALVLAYAKLPDDRIEAEARRIDEGEW